jgi:putative ABC transport system permease protein
MVLKYWPLIWSALIRKPAEGLLTFLAVAAGFTLLALMIGMNLTTRDMLEHARRDLLIVDTRFYDPNGGPQGLPLAIGEQIGSLAGVRAVTPYRWLSGYHVDPHQSFSVRMVGPGFRAIWSDVPITAAQWDHLFAIPTGILISARAALHWGVKPGDVFTLTTQPGTRADGGTSWEFQVLDIVPDDPSRSGTIGYILGNAQYVENTAPLNLRGADYYYYVTVKDPAKAMAISQQIDDRYMNSSRATLTVQERFNMLSRANRGFDTVSMTLAIGGAGFVMVLFLTANAIARSVRERVPEFAVLKTVGFLGGHLMVLVFIETAIPCVLGAALGTAIAALVSHWATHLLPPNFARMLTTSLPPLPVLALSIGLAVVLALGSCALPMLRLRRLSVTDALAGR